MGGKKEFGHHSFNFPTVQSTFQKWWKEYWALSPRRQAQSSRPASWHISEADFWKQHKYLHPEEYQLLHLKQTAKDNRSLTVLFVFLTSLCVFSMTKHGTPSSSLRLLIKMDNCCNYFPLLNCCHSVPQVDASRCRRQARHLAEQ